MKKLDFDSAIEKIDNLPNDAEVNRVKEVIERVRKEDKEAVVDYVVSKGWIVE